MPYIYLNLFLMYCAFYICGYPLKAFFLKDDLRGYDPYITPWLGIGLVVCVFFPLSWLGFSVASSAGYFSLSVLAAAAAVWLKTKEGACFGKNDVIFLMSLGLIAGAAYGFKIAADRDLCAVTFSADYASYLNDAKAALLSSARRMASFPDGVPQIASINMSLNFETRGCVFAQAFISALFNHDLAGMSYLLSVFVMFLNAASLRLFFRDFKYMSVAVPVAGILLINSFWGRLVYMAFTGQLFSMGFVIAAFFIERRLAESERFEPAVCALLVFLLTACNLTYLNAMPFPLIPVLALPLILLCGKNAARKACLKNAALAGGIFAAVNFRLIMNFYEVYIMRTEELLDGFAMHMTTFLDMAGLQGAFSTAGGFLAALVISNAVIPAILIYQLSSEFREERRPFLPAGGVLLFAVHAAVCVKFFRVGEISSYNAYKSALSISFAAYIPLLRFFEERLGYIRENGIKVFGGPRKKLAMSAAALALFAAAVPLNLRSELGDIDALFARKSAYEALTKSFDAIKFFVASPAYSESDFIVNAELPLTEMASQYFSPLGRTYTNGYGGVPHYTRRVMKDSFRRGDVYIAFAQFEESLATVSGRLLYENDRLKIYRLDEHSLIQYDYEGLSHEIQKVIINGTDELLARQVAGNTVRLRYQTLAASEWGIALTFQNFSRGPLKARVSAGGVPVTELSAGADGLTRIVLENVAMAPGLNDVTVEFDGDVSDLILREIKILKTGRRAPRS